MSLISVTKSVNLSNDIVANAVTHPIINTHCNVCGKAFDMGRVGKKYCSNRCKQFSYNNKDRLSTMIETKKFYIPVTPIEFILNDYVDYDKTQKKLRRYFELDKKVKKWEAIDQEINQKNKLDVPISVHTFNSLATEKLTESESFELYDLQRELDEDFFSLSPVALSLEQWSFIKAMYPAMDKKGFFQIASSLSKSFLSQLNFMEIDPGNITAADIITNKYINHCNYISEGIITFVNNVIVEE
jgi:predicted nucleic acid-binding Zn ribbon protein